MNQLLKWHNTKLISSVSCSTASLYIVGLDTKKDPRLTAEACTPHAMIVSFDASCDHLSVFIRFHKGLRTETLSSNLSFADNCRFSLSVFDSKRSKPIT